MGTIDSVTVTISCPSCGATEASRVLDKGNPWSGSSWQAPSFSRFQTSVSGLDEPHFTVTAACRRCNTPAHVDEQFAT